MNNVQLTLCLTDHRLLSYSLSSLSSREREEEKRERKNTLFCSLCMLNLSSNCTNVCICMKQNERDGYRVRRERERDDGDERIACSNTKKELILQIRFPLHSFQLASCDYVRDDVYFRLVFSILVVAFRSDREEIVLATSSIDIRLFNRQIGDERSVFFVFSPLVSRAQVVISAANWPLSFLLKTSMTTFIPG